MSIQTDSRDRYKPLSNFGPYLATVVNVLDSTFMGGLEVSIDQGQLNNVDFFDRSLPVKYLSPFYGVMNQNFEGPNQQKFDDVQKSYGFWMVPPDVGTKVLVMFAGGDTQQGYWIGCVPDIHQNQMIPGIAASQNVYITPEEEVKYGTKNLPVAEFHKRTIKDSPTPGNQPKPIHPFAERLLEQGLITDKIRGVTSSSARRETPSAVFGISTPGPLDPNGRTVPQGKETKKPFPVSRLGGTQFVMDDGDEKGLNELVRLRTRTGHQILLHNSADLVYIANSKGTAWIELTSNGKIDIYAADSVSIHSENDFNFLADRDINLEAGRNINVKSNAKLEVNVSDICNFICNSEGKLTFGGDLNINTDGDFRLTAGATSNLISKDDFFINSSGAFDVTAEKDSKVTTKAAIHIKSTGDALVTSDAVLNLSAAGNLLAKGAQVHFNGPEPALATAAAQGSPALIPTPLPVFSLPNRSTDSGWANGKFYKSEDLITIMRRAPTHEPWDHHENINPEAFMSQSTTSDLNDTRTFVPGTKTAAGSRPIKPVDITYTQAPATAGTPPTPTGNVEEDNIAAFLWMIRVCEGTSGPDGYRTMFTGKLFDGFADHPRKANKGGGLVSTAAGAYQFLSSTWDECQKALNLPDFSPSSQDKACIFLLKRRKALDAIKNGNFTRAIQLCNKEWASLPGSPYNQNPKSLPVALSFFKQGGGTAVA